MPFRVRGELLGCLRLFASYAMPFRTGVPGFQRVQVRGLCAFGLGLGCLLRCRESRLGLD